MRRIVTAGVIASTILVGGCNTVRGVGRDVSSLKEVVPSGGHASADTPAAPSPDYVPAATP